MGLPQVPQNLKDAGTDAPHFGQATVSAEGAAASPEATTGAPPNPGAAGGAEAGGAAAGAAEAGGAAVGACA